MTEQNCHLLHMHGNHRWRPSCRHSNRQTTQMSILPKIGTICGAAAELTQPQKKPPASLMVRLSLRGCNSCHTSKGRTYNGTHAESAREDKSFLGRCGRLSFLSVHRCRTLPSWRWMPLTYWPGPSSCMDIIKISSLWWAGMIFQHLYKYIAFMGLHLGERKYF